MHRPAVRLRSTLARRMQMHARRDLGILCGVVQLAFQLPHDLRERIQQGVDVVLVMHHAEADA